MNTIRDTLRITEGVRTEVDAFAADQGVTRNVAYNYLLRKGLDAAASGGILPQWEQPCPVCTGPAGDAARERDRKASDAWHEKESKAFRAWVIGRTESAQMLAHLWPKTPERCAVGSEPEPEIGHPDGCVECDFRGAVVTPAGRELRALMARWK